MILVLSGTRDGSEIIKKLREKGYPVLASATTAYGAKLADEAGAEETLGGRLSAKEMCALIKEKGVSAVVDATHPFAQEASKNAMKACKAGGTPYLRFERRKSSLPESPLIHYCTSFEEAAAKAVALGGIVFCTLGTTHLGPFVEAARKEGRRLIARVLSTREALDKCAALGLEPRNIVALQGPGSLELNIAMLRDYGAEVLVTKESGSMGGEETKVEAAVALGMPVVLITRPEVEYGVVAREYGDVLSWLEGQ